MSYSIFDDEERECIWNLIMDDSDSGDVMVGEVFWEMLIWIWESGEENKGMSDDDGCLSNVNGLDKN